jgi:hypothetical protein
MFVGLGIAAFEGAPVILLVLTALCIIASAMPVFFTNEFYEDFSWGYRETIGRLITPVSRRVVSRAFLEGICGATLLFIWPLGVFMLFDWSYGLLGTVLTITLLLSIVMRKPVRRFFRRRGLHTSRYVNTLLAVSPWVLRAIVATPFGVIITDTYFLSSAPTRWGADAIAYEQSSDGGSYLDEFTALKEMALALGRASICLVAAIIALSSTVATAFIAAFLIAACASAALSLRS